MQIIHRFLDHPGDEELEKIDGQQGDDPPEQLAPVGADVRPQQPDGGPGLDELAEGGKEFNGAAC